MGQNIEAMLLDIARIMDKGLDAAGAARIVGMLGGGTPPLPVLEEAMLYNEFLPKIEEHPYSPRERWLHFLWDSLDKLPAAALANLAIRLRRMIAERLFKKCGKNLIVEEGLRFNFPNNIEVGDNVYMNRGCFIDSKGGVKLGDGVGFGECVFVYTHNHAEAAHTRRFYKPVVFGDYSCVYSFAVILGGVTVGKEAVVSAKSLVHEDVPEGMFAAGTPAKAVRPTHNEGHHGAELEHIWLYKGAFQLYQP